MLDFLKSAAKPPSDLLGIIRYVRARWRARLAVKGAVRLIAVNVAVFFLLAYLMQWSRFSATSILSARLLLAVAIVAVVAVTAATAALLRKLIMLISLRVLMRAAR